MGEEKNKFMKNKKIKIQILLLIKNWVINLPSIKKKN